jgi:hypothetical protein
MVLGGALFLLCHLCAIVSGNKIPTLEKGGRRDVHGWLILPFDQPKPEDPTTPLKAWFSHHVPEFWLDSPHNFQIILEGLLYPVASVEKEYFGFHLPYSPNEDNLVYEYSFTPPSPFSLKYSYQSILFFSHLTYPPLSLCLSSRRLSSPQ